MPMMARLARPSAAAGLFVILCLTSDCHKASGFKSAPSILIAQKLVSTNSLNTGDAGHHCTVARKKFTLRMETGNSEERARRVAVRELVFRGLGAVSVGLALSGGCAECGAKGKDTGVQEGGQGDLFTSKPQVGINKRTQRLWGCSTQQNCVSVSAFKNPTQFSAAYDYTITSQNVDEAWATLKSVIEGDVSLKIVEVDDQMYYLHAEGKSKVPSDGVDDVEFLFVPEQKILTYRSASRENKFVYPYQVPIPDGGYQKARMNALRNRLGWVELNYAGDGIYSDGCGKKGDQACNPFGGLESLGGGDYIPEDGLPRADKFRLPW